MATRRIADMVAENRRITVLRVLADAEGPLSGREIAARCRLGARQVTGTLIAAEKRFEAERDSIREDRTGAKWSISHMGRIAVTGSIDTESPT